MVNNGRFKKGQHWRPRKPFWDRDWMVREYIDKQRTCSDIGKEFGVTENAIAFWLAKHGIKGRTMVEVRRLKHWGVSGSANPMAGKLGPSNPNWKGGYTPIRQHLYSNAEWKKAARIVKKRDKVCRLCGSTLKLEIHHIEPFSQAPLLMFFVGNLILLCNVCHKKMLGKERRWRKRLLSLIQKGGN